MYEKSIMAKDKEKPSRGDGGMFLAGNCYTGGMKRYSTIFLQAVVVLIGIGALAFMLWEPHLEGRNVQATLSQIYFNDPFLWYAYAASVVFFMALYQTFRLLGYIRSDEAFSERSVKAVRTIKRSALILIGLIMVPEIYLVVVRPGDDIAGGVMMGLLLMLVSAIVVATADVLEGLLMKR